MRIKVQTLFVWGTLLCLMLDIGYQYLPGINILYFGYTVQVQALLCILLAFACWIDSDKQYIMSPYIKKTNWMILLICVLLVIELIYTSQYTDLTFDEAWLNFLPYFKLLLYYPFVYILDRFEDLRISKAIRNVTYFILIYSALVAVIYNLTGANIDSNIIKIERAQRFGLVRLSSISLTWIAVLFCCMHMLYAADQHEKRINTIATIFGFAFVFLINQGRACYAAVFVMLICMYLAKERRGKKQIVSYSVVMIAFATMSFAGVFSSFLNTLSPDYSGTYTANTMLTRFLQLETFDNMVKNMPLKYLLGLGLRPTVTSKSSVYYFLDTGLIGDFYNMGAVALIIYFTTLFKVVRGIALFRRKKGKEFVYFVGVLAFLIVGVAGYSILPYNRIITLPIIWAFSDYYINRRGVAYE